MSPYPETAREWASPDIERVLMKLAPDRLAQCFEPANVPSDVAQRLLDAPRFHPRLMRVIERHFELGDPAVAFQADPAARFVLLASDDAKKTFALACGTVLYAQAFTTIVEAAKVRALRERFGSEVLERALRLRHLGLAVERMTDMDALQAGIERDGEACIEAWRRELPPALAGWLRMDASDSGGKPPLSDAVRSKGPEIVRALAREWLTAEES
ncbi:hypothetical protein [Pseudomonas sp. Marseille-QA0892]